MKTKVKICGMTNIDDALMAAALGADALGFIFAPSKRRITPEMAKEIIKELPPFITTVGVFMDEKLDMVNELADYTGIDVVQLHGNESPEYCTAIKKKLIKRIFVIDVDITEMLVARAKKYSVSAYLLDPGAGSGKIFDWHVARGIELPLIVAGGLTPDNVKDVTTLVRPYGVDVVSGVEESSGKKDREKVKKFIEEVRSC
jgi:phosphoribosylanthranilate isomerase